MNNLKMTPKDLLYLEDIFNWNMTLIKKINLYEKNISISDMTARLGDCKKLHTDICRKIKEMVKGACE